MPRGKTTKTKTTKTTKRTPTTKRKTTYKTSYGSINEMAVDAGSVLKSLVNHDGKYDIPTAKTISSLFGNQISLLKEKVNIAKINNNVTNNDVLRLEE